MTMEKAVIRFVFFIILSQLSACSIQVENTRLRSKVLPEKPYPAQTDLEAYGLKGAVKEWTRESYKHTGYSSEKHLLQKEIYHFNRSGMIIQVMRFDQEMKPVSRDEKKYDEKGRIEKEIYYGPENEILRTINYVYHPDGYLSASIDQNRVSNLIYTSRWSYDFKRFSKTFERFLAENYEEKIMSRIVSQYLKPQNKFKIDHFEYQRDGQLLFHRSSVYNHEDQLISEIEKDAQGKILLKKEIHYNSKGQPERQREWEQNQDTGELTELRTHWAYDNDDHLIALSEPMENQNYIYDSQGRMAEYSKENGRGIMKLHKVFHYDSLGDLFREENDYFDSEGRFSYQYVFEYNRKKQVVRWTKTDELKNPAFTFSSQYDSDSQLVGEVQEGPYKDDLYQYDYQYDGQGNHLKTRCYYLGKLSDLHIEEPQLYHEYLYEVQYWE